MSEPKQRMTRLSVVALRERLSDRDLQILDDVSRLRLMRARHLEALHFPADRHANATTAARRCRRVLERLTRDRLLVRLERRIGGVRAGSASFVYTLSPLGQRVLDHGGARRRLLEPSERFVDHTLAVADFFVEIAAAAGARRWELLEWQSEPTCWREVVTLGGRVVLRPDLFVVLGVGEYELRWFVEIDRGSEHGPAVRRKCRLHHSYYKSGQEQRQHRVSPRVLWVVPDERRVVRLEELISNDPRLTADLFRVATKRDALMRIGDRS